jgi:hypothetical protein
MSSRMAMRALRLAAVSALLALSLMVWGVLDPHPISLVVAMSVGQALGTLSFALYGLVVLIDLRQARVLSANSRRVSSPSSDDSSGKPS